MDSSGRPFSVQTLYGPLMKVGSHDLVLESQAFMVRLPFGGFVWHRPAAVHVTRNGESRRMAIVDLTRLIQSGLLGLTSFLVILTRLQFNRRKELDR